jgi:hypothetical protein
MQQHEQQLLQRQQHTSGLCAYGGAAAVAAPGSGNATGGGARRTLSQQQLSELVQQQLGYSLAVRPSLINHQAAGVPLLLACVVPSAQDGAAQLLLPPPLHAAGLGLFVEGHAAPGALVALFPGLVYRRKVYRWAL